MPWGKRSDDRGFQRIDKPRLPPGNRGKSSTNQCGRNGHQHCYQHQNQNRVPAVVKAEVRRGVLPKDITLRRRPIASRPTAARLTSTSEIGKYAGSALETLPNNRAVSTSNSLGVNMRCRKVEIDPKPAPMTMPTNSKECMLPCLPVSNQP